VAKTIKKSEGNAGLQQTANALWKNLSEGERRAYESQAQEANENSMLTTKTESRQKRAKKLMNIVRDSVSQILKYHFD